MNTQHILPRILIITSRHDIKALGTVRCSLRYAQNISKHAEVLAREKIVTSKGGVHVFYDMNLREFSVLPVGFLVLLGCPPSNPVSASRASR